MASAMSLSSRWQPCRSAKTRSTLKCLLALRAKTLALETAAPAAAQGPTGPADAAERAQKELELAKLRADLKTAIAEGDRERGEVVLMVAEQTDSEAARGELLFLRIGELQKRLASVVSQTFGVDDLRLQVKDLSSENAELRG
eukprot:15473091-Alexandrium_andersonii.AAC.1